MLGLGKIRREEIEIVEPRPCEIERPHALHHQSACEAIDPEAGPDPTPKSADGRAVTGGRGMKDNLLMPLDFVVRGIDRGAKHGMYDRHVVAFEIILDICFPVAANLVACMPRQPEGFERHVA